MRPTALTASRVFHVTHAPHGRLVFGADQPASTGYRVWTACSYGAAVGMGGQRR